MIPSRRDREERRFRAALMALILLTQFLIVVMGGRGGGGELEDAGSLPPPADYNIFSRLSSLEGEIQQSVDPPQIVNYSAHALPLNIYTPHNIPSNFMNNYEVADQELSLPKLKEPLIIEEVKKNPRANYTTLLDWVLPQPLSEGSLNFGVMTYQEGYVNWKLGSLIPRLVFTDSDLSRWVYIDTDNDSSTGDSAGRDIRVRLGVTQASVEINPPTILPPTPPSLSFEEFTITLEVEALGTPNPSPLEVYVVKAISYSGKNYLWCLGAGADHPPSRLIMSVRAERVVARFERGSFSGFSLSNLSSAQFSFIDVVGPYSISYWSQDGLSSFSPHIALLKVEDLRIVGYSHLTGTLTPSLGYSSVPPSGNLSLDFPSLTSPINELVWRAGEEGSGEFPTRLDLAYREEDSASLYAVAKVTDLPPSLHIKVDRHSTGGKNVTELTYHGSHTVGRLAFHEEILSPTGELSVTTMLIKELPLTLHLSTTGGEFYSYNATFPVNASLGIVGGMLEGVMGKISERFGRIGRVLRSLPRSVATLPEEKGWLEAECEGGLGEIFYASGELKYLTTSSSSYLSIYQANEDAYPTLSIRLKNVQKGELNFSSGFKVALTLLKRQKVDLAGIIPGGETLLMVDSAPGEMTILQDPEGERLFLGLSERVEEVHLLGRSEEVSIEMIIEGLMGEAEIINLKDTFWVSFGTHVENFQAYMTNSATFIPRFYPISNFLSIHQRGISGEISIKLQRVSFFRFVRGTAPIIEIRSEGAGDLLIELEEAINSLSLRGAFRPLPEYLNMTLPSNLTGVEIPLPSLYGGDFTGIAEGLLSLTGIADSLLNLTYNALDSMVERLGAIGQNMSLSWRVGSDQSTDLVLHVQRLGSAPFKPASWTHGLWIYQSGKGRESSLDMKIFLMGLPSEGSLSFSFEEETLVFDLDFEGYSPAMPWLLVRTLGFQDRDITIYMNDIKSGINMDVKAEITTNMSIGGRIVAHMEAHVSTLEGEPVDLGEVLARLRKLGEEPSLREIYMPALPADFSFRGRMERDIDVNYSSSQYLEFLYIKLSKSLKGRWSQIYGIFHDLPLSFSARIVSNPLVSLRHTLTLQGFPTFSLATSGRDIDLYINYDGKGLGQRGRYQLFVENAGDTETYYHGSMYVLKSEGIEYFTLEMENIPYIEGFTINSLIFSARDVKSLALDSSMLPGGLPVIYLKKLEVRNVKAVLDFSLKVRGKDMSPRGSFYVYRVSSSGFTRTLSLQSGPLEINLEGYRSATIIPAPIVMMWQEAISGVVS